MAHRITAVPPHMNLLAVSVQYFAKPEIIRYIKKGSFHPMPSVDSAVIRLTPHTSRSFKKGMTSFFLETARGGFSHRRKFLINNIASALGIQKGTLKSAFMRCSLSEKIRAENLSIDDWARLVRVIIRSDSRFIDRAEESQTRPDL
jgi:16S rRNA (adenine1518-N6/adenine1519-N6)-dimethyltransferase